jgi:pilus assembly protein CpaE
MTTTMLLAAHDPTLEELFRSAGVVARVPPELLETGAAISAEPPDVLIADVRGHSRLPAWLTDWRRRHPALRVVLVTSSPDPALMLAAIRSGVSECLVEPITRAEAQAAIGRIVTGQVTTTGEIVAFVGARGGVGTTTVAVNVAAALSKVAGGTLMIDLNTAGGDAALLLGAHSGFSLLDALANTHRADETFFRGLLTETRCGLPLLASPAVPFGAPLEAGRLRALLEFVRQRYRYTILDVPRAGSAAPEALRAAGVTVIVANQEIATLRSAALMAAAVRSGQGVDPVRAILNRYDPGAALDKKDAEESTGVPVMACFPSCYGVVADAANRGEPVSTSRHEIGRAFARFARALARVPEGTERGAGVLSRVGSSLSAVFTGGV